MTTPRTLHERLHHAAAEWRDNGPDDRMIDLLQEAGDALKRASDRQWQRGDLVLVDGTKEGCVLSVNGNVAQVSMWAAQAAVVNVERLSPLEAQRQHVHESSAPGCSTARVEHPEPSFLQRLAGHPEWHQRSHPDVRAALAEGHAEIVATMDYYLVTLKLLPAGKAALEASK